MAFRVFTDSCSNLPGTLLRTLKIDVLPCSYTVDGQLVHFNGDIESFDSHAYYDDNDETGYEGYDYDGGTHLEIFTTATPEPDSAAAEG